MDRVETDGDGRAYVVDFKTGKHAPTSAEVAHHPQLAVYQLAVREGAVDEAFEGVRPQPGGAELVQLRQGAPKRDGGETLPRCRLRTPLEGPAGERVGDLLATAAGKVLDERFAPDHGPALHPLRLPRVVQRTARGTARRGVSGPRERAARCDETHHRR